MTYPEYLTACAVMDKVNEIDKAIEYMETVPVSTECYEAVKDMLEYDKKGLIDEFHNICCSKAGNTIETIENDKASKSKIDDLEIHC